jgi:hypothetical protein
MEGVFIKAAIKRGQKSLLILLSVSRLDHRQGCSDDKKTADIAVRRANEEYCLFESIDHLRPLKIIYII